VTNPRGKFAGVLEELWSDGKESAIYRVPRRFPGLARVVNTDRLNGLRSIMSNNDVDALKSHYELLENGPDSNPQTEWEDTGILCIGTHIEAGQSLIVQTMHDDGWHAYSSGNRVPLRKSALGFIRLDPSPGDHEIRLVFETPMEALIGRVIAFACALGLIAMQFRARREAV
jgi:uncharacterized membrane protein YfhO